MTPADSIRKLGFRRWYERQLIDAHACLVTGFLCMIVALATLEGFSFRGDGVKVLLTLMTVFAAGAIGLSALRRYLKVLGRAERIAEHSTCTKCSAYGRLQILAAGSESSAPAEGFAPWMRVQCRKCGHQWLIE